MGIAEDLMASVPMATFRPKTPVRKPPRPPPPLEGPAFGVKEAPTFGISMAQRDELYRERHETEDRNLKRSKQQPLDLHRSHSELLFVDSEYRRSHGHLADKARELRRTLHQEQTTRRALKNSLSDGDLRGVGLGHRERRTRISADATGVEPAPDASTDRREQLLLLNELSELNKLQKQLEQQQQQLTIESELHHLSQQRRQQQQQRRRQARLPPLGVKRSQAPKATGNEESSVHLPTLVPCITRASLNAAHPIGVSMALVWHGNVALPMTMR